MTPRRLQELLGARQEPGHFVGKVTLCSRMLLEMRATAMVYCINPNQMVRQMVAWAAIHKNADSAVKNRLARPLDPDVWIIHPKNATYKDGVKAELTLDWPPRLMKYLGMIYARCKDSQVTPWPRGRHVLAVVIEAIWMGYRNKFKELSRLECPFTVEDCREDPSLFRLRYVLEDEENRKHHSLPYWFEAEFEDEGEPKALAGMERAPEVVEAE